MTEPAEGAVPAGDFEPVPEASSSEVVAREVISGMWGRGRTRAKRLQDAGYDVGEVNKEINKILNR